MSSAMDEAKGDRMYVLDALWSSRIRVSIVRLVRSGEAPLTVEEIARELPDVSRRTVGRHVRVLAESGVLVEARVGDGRYAVDNDVMREGLRELSRLFLGTAQK